MGLLAGLILCGISAASASAGPVWVVNGVVLGLVGGLPAEVTRPTHFGPIRWRWTHNAVMYEMTCASATDEDTLIGTNPGTDKMISMTYAGCEAKAPAGCKLKEAKVTANLPWPSILVTNAAGNFFEVFTRNDSWEFIECTVGTNNAAFNGRGTIYAKVGAGAEKLGLTFPEGSIQGDTYGEPGSPFEFTGTDEIEGEKGGKLEVGKETGAGGPFWRHREGGKGGAKIEANAPEEVRGEGGEQKLKGKVTGIGLEVLAASVQVKGIIYNNSDQAQSKLELKYHELSVSGKPGCVVTVGQQNTVKVFGHQAWKWNGEKKQLEETAYPGIQPVDWIFLPVELQHGATTLPKGTFATLSFTNKNEKETCTFNNQKVEVTGSVAGEIKPGILGEWSSEQATTTPEGGRLQHFWNGKEFVGVETKLFIGAEKEEAKLVGETKVKPNKQEVALFEN